ncbi:AAC(3) family N-acetyltransferase [soil metagenome]
MARAERPATVASLVKDLQELGLVEASTVMVHSSLSRLGYVCGGAPAVVAALFESVGPQGTVVMPTHSGDFSDPAAWSRPPVPEAWWDTIRSEMPAYHPLLTPTRQMGAIVECFRHVPGARRSAHPAVSVTAVGPTSDRVVADHGLTYGHGETSPLARLYDLDAQVLLLGVSHANNTALHLAEYRARLANKAWTTNAAPIWVDGRREWTSYPDLEGDDGDFERIGQGFAGTGREAQGPVGAGTGRLMSCRDVVDHAVRWMEANRT